MNRTKSAAVLMLVGAFAAGGGTLYAGSRLVEAQRAKQSDGCPQPRSENNYRQRFAEFLGLDSTQQRMLDALISERNTEVSEIFAAPRAKVDSVMKAARATSDSILAAPRLQADSVRNAIQVKQNAVFTAEQRAKLEQRRTEMDIRRKEQSDQKARCERQQQQNSQKSAPSTKNKSNH